MEQGWVYVLVNPTLPGLVKVGRTSRLPSTRVAELSQATGVATPFILVFEQEFTDCISAERDIHAAMDRCGMRVAANREFFRGPTSEVVRLVLQYAGGSGNDNAPAAVESGTALLQNGDRHLFGDGDSLHDLNAAFRCYQLAAIRGSVVAFERMGAIMVQTHSAISTGRNRATSYLKEGARRGNYYCYCEIAAAAAEEGNRANFSKAWDLFFLHRQSAWLGEAEEGLQRYPGALRRYVITSLALDLQPLHLPELRAEGDALTHILARSIEQEQNPPSMHQILILSLQWVRQALLGRTTGGQPSAAAPIAPQSWGQAAA